MGTDYRLLTDTTSLDLDTQGWALYDAAAANGYKITPELLKSIPTFSRGNRLWRGIWCYVRDQGEAIIRSENDEDEEYWTERATRFSVYSRNGHWKRLGYGPL